MLTEGWDCNTVTHVVGLRPFQSQLLCEQVVGRALRRRFYQSDRMTRPFRRGSSAGIRRALRGGAVQGDGCDAEAAPAAAPHPCGAAEGQFAITVPRVLGYSIGVRNRITVDWATVARLVLDPAAIPPQSDLAAMLNQGSPARLSPGGLIACRPSGISSRPSRAAVVFPDGRRPDPALRGEGHLRGAGARAFSPVAGRSCSAISLRRCSRCHRPSGSTPFSALLWLDHRTPACRHPSRYRSGRGARGPDLDRDRPCATSDISVFTSKHVREAVRSHVNLVSSIRSGRQPRRTSDPHPAVDAYVKNVGLNFTIPYLHNGKPSDYLPDYVIRLGGGGPLPHRGDEGRRLGGLAEVKAQAAHRWCAAVNATGEFGRWDYTLASTSASLPRSWTRWRRNAWSFQVDRSRIQV